jgi:ketosteroid isomerase-like protein
MSEENVETVRRIVEAFCAGEWTTTLDTYYDDAVELDQSRMPDGGVYHGRDGMREFYRRWIGSWDHFEAQPLEFIDAGDAGVIALMQIRGIGKGSGAAVTMRSADVYTVARGKVVRHVGYPDASQALEAAGLRE